MRTVESAMDRKAGIPSGALALRAELQGKKTKKIGSVAFGDRCAVLRLGNDSLWAIIEGQKGCGMARRCAWAPGASLEFESKSGGEISLLSSLGSYRVTIEAPDADASILHVTTRLTPSAEVNVPWWPRDLYPFAGKYDPEAAQGKVFAAQRGLNTALVYGQLDEPGEGTFFYLQDLTSLNDFYSLTGTTPDGVVGGEWPELGYCAPAVRETPLKADEEVTISDAFLSHSSQRNGDERAEARIFIEHLSAIYAHIQRPEIEFRDWPAKAEATLRDLDESPLATVEDGGYRYIRPYVDAEVPDSMVQITLLNAIREFGYWKGETSSLVEQLRAGIYRFFDPEIGSIRRYLNTVGPDKDIDEVDSWYLYHPLQGLARMAKDGDEGAKDLFLASLDYGIEVARRFNYCWPIQFSLSTKEIITAERKPGEPGQTDAGGLYAYVMLHAYELTGEERYLDEAKSAIRATSEMDFELAYQTNLTSWGATACLRLWKVTNDRFFLDQATVFFASFFHNCTIWQSEIGKVSEPRMFLGVTCLHDGPYIAPYECYESFCAFHECLALAEDDLSDSVRIMLGEFIRYGLERGWWFYPSSLKESSPAHSPRNGVIARNLAFPLEDIYVNGDPAGQVGQEVYGAGAGLAYSTRAFHPLGNDRMLFCQYPVREEDRTETGMAFSVRGGPGWSCSAQILPSEGVTLEIDGKKTDPASFEIRVGARAELRWTP
ncbi:hypothetical protein EON81_00975 [bacterium]|nr:MAG: hypothetical protein EON81_00975 [bacterium]